MSSLPMGMETTSKTTSKTRCMSGLPEQDMERDATMTEDPHGNYNRWVKIPVKPPRIKLSIKLGVLGGIIWGLFFAAYYSMLPNFKFAFWSATECFVIMVLVVLGLPLLIEAFKKTPEEKDDEENEP